MAEGHFSRINCGVHLGGRLRAPSKKRGFCWQGRPPRSHVLAQALARFSAAGRRFWRSQVGGDFSGN